MKRNLLKSFIVAVSLVLGFSGAQADVTTTEEQIDGRNYSVRTFDFLSWTTGDPTLVTSGEKYCTVEDRDVEMVTSPAEFDGYIGLFGIGNGGGNGWWLRQDGEGKSYLYSYGAGRPGALANLAEGTIVEIIGSGVTFADATDGAGAAAYTENTVEGGIGATIITTGDLGFSGGKNAQITSIVIKTPEQINLDPVSIYERGTTTAWSDADVAEWAGATLTVDPTYGLGIDGNGTYTATKTLDGVVANSKMTYAGTWHVGSSTGRDANFAWIQFGDGLRLSWGNYYSLRVTLNGESSTSGTEIFKGSNTSFDLPFSITVNTATKAIEKFEFNGEDITEKFAGVAVEGENFNTISQGFIRGGSVSWTVPNFLTNIEVIQQQQDLSTASYTIKYVDGEGNEVREAVVRSGVIGNPIVLASTDTENFFTEGETPVKYIYVSNDAEGKTIEAGDATVVTVTFRQAATMHYTVSASIADQTIALVDSSYFEGETVYYNFPRYYAIDGALYQKPEGEKDPGFYRGSAVLTEDNQAITVTGYSLIDTVNVAYFSEAEDIEGLTLSSNTTAEVRMSMGKTAFNGGTEPVTIVTLPAGQYKIYTTTWGSAGQTFTFYAGDVDILMAECTGSSADASAEFTLMEETAITLAGDPSITNGGIDYVLIDKTGDVVVEQADATFDFNANAWGLPTSNNDDQNAGNLGDQTIEEEGVVLSFTDGGTATRLWAGSVTELRFYKNGGSVTVTAPVNKVITKIELDGDIDLTASEGTLDGTTWTGNATAVTFSANATNKINTIDVYLAAAPAVVVENIAALKALPAGTVARLTLNDTKISVKAATMMGTYTIIEDETGGILILPDQTGMVGDITTMFPEQFANDSVALNGYIYATVSDMNGLPALDICDSTSVSEFTATPCELTPKTIEIADATNQENGMRLVQFVKATVTATGLTQGDATIPIMDMLGIMMGELPETEIDITGFVLDLGADLGGAMFVPLSYSDKNYNAIDGVNADADSLDGDVYSINGVKVRNAGESLDGLKGLYIINGKKVVLD